MIDSNTAQALGVDRKAPAQIVAEYLCRQADRYPISTLPPLAADWFVKVAGALGAHLPDPGVFDTRDFELGPTAGGGFAPSMPGPAAAKEVAKEVAPLLQRRDAPAVLAAVAPDAIVGGCPARDLERVCRALVARHLEMFCLRVLETWAQEGHLRD